MKFSWWTVEFVNMASGETFAAGLKHSAQVIKQQMATSDAKAHEAVSQHGKDIMKLRETVGESIWPCHRCVRSTRTTCIQSTSKGGQTRSTLLFRTTRSTPFDWSWTATPAPPPFADARLTMHVCTQQDLLCSDANYWSFTGDVVWTDTCTTYSHQQGTASLSAWRCPYVQREFLSLEADPISYISPKGRPQDAHSTSKSHHHPTEDRSQPLFFSNHVLHHHAAYSLAWANCNGDISRLPTIRCTGSC